MKTPLQELIEFTRKRKDFIDDESYNEAMKEVILIALSLLGEEKNQIIDFAFDFYHYMSHKNKVPENLITENRDHAEDHFNEKYNK